MNRDQIINWIINDKIVEKTISKICKHRINQDLKNELAQTVYLILLEKDPSYIEKIHQDNKIPALIQIIIKFQFYKNGQFYKQWFLIPKKLFNEIPSEYEEV